MSLALLFAICGLVGVGMYLVTARSLPRIVLGFSMLGHAAVLSLLASGGEAAAPPLAGSSEEPLANPLPQALSLTAIVISFGLTLFLLALARRQDQLTGDDLVEDDLEDRRIAESDDAESETGAEADDAAADEAGAGADEAEAEAGADVSEADVAADDEVTT